jgi:hypothetical protein
MKRHLYLLLLLGCSSSETTPSASTTPAPDAGGGTDDAAVVVDADAPKDAEPAFDGSCVVAGFGDKLTAGFGRIDGVISAIQMPNDQTCSMPNRDHLILQVLMNGAVYRMVVNTDVKVLALDHALPSPAFAEGWHTGIGLDYATDLGAHSTSFADPGDMDATVQATIGAGLKVGDKVSVYATSGDGRPESAHLVHRNDSPPSSDGAIVVHPDGASPKLVLFAFDNQTF